MSKFLFHHQQAPWNKALWNWLWAAFCPKKIQIFLQKALRDQLPTKTYLSFGRPLMDSHCPKYQSPETTLHILRDCPWAKEVWHQSSSILPLSFFQLSLQEWLRDNAMVGRASLPHQPPWHVYFLFTCWKLWLARNERIQAPVLLPTLRDNSLVQVATEFHFLSDTNKQPLICVPQLIRQQPPPHPYFKLNTDGSALDNPSLARAKGVLRDHQGRWISGFLAWVGLATNNMAELAAVRQGLAMAWNAGVKLLQLELESKVVLTWLTHNNLNYPTNMLPLICDCRNLLDQAWEVHMQHVYHEANGCVDDLAKRGTRQRNLMTMYSECPTFVYESYVRDLSGMGES